MENFDPMAIIESGVEQMTAVSEKFATDSNATDESQGQKGLDYSELSVPPVIWYPVNQPLTNKIDVIPFIVTEKWYESLLTFPPTQEQRARGMQYAVKRGIKLKNGGAIDYFLEMPFHRFATGQSGDVICLREAFGASCPYCDRMFEEYKKRNDGDPDAEARAKSLKTSWRTFANIYNYMYEHTPNAPEGHEGYEIIDDYGRGALLSHIYAASMNAGVGQGFLANWSHPKEGRSLLFDSVYKPPTSKKYKNGHYEFPIIKFVDREPKDIDYTDDIVESVRFDKLVSKLIYSESEMMDMLRMKMKDGHVEKTGQIENQNVDYGQPDDSGHGINEVPANTSNTPADMPEENNDLPDGADDTPIVSQVAEQAAPAGRRRGSRQSSSAAQVASTSRRTPTEIRNDAEAGAAQANQPESTTPATSRRRRAR